MEWTERRVEKLKELWAEGLAASNIAGILGGVSRNAVIGKVHRLGLSGRTKKNNQNNQRTENISKAKKRWDYHIFGRASIRRKPKETIFSGVYMSEKQEEKAIPPEQRVKFIDLEAGQCKWPIGDPKHEDFGFCGKKRECGSPYCTEHDERAYQPMGRRKVKRQLQGAA